MAIALVDSIHFDFAKFGTSHQGIALSARAFDIQTQSYLKKHPSATVVALAEGLQTSFWRLEAAIPDSQFRWLTVDLPPIVDVRTRLLPPSPRDGHEYFILFPGESYIRVSRIQESLRNEIGQLTCDTIASKFSCWASRRRLHAVSRESVMPQIKMPAKIDRCLR